MFGFYSFWEDNKVPTKVCDICGKTRKVSDMYVLANRAICRTHTLKARAKNKKLK